MILRRNDTCTRYNGLFNIFDVICITQVLDQTAMTHRSQGGSASLIMRKSCLIQHSYYAVGLVSKLNRTENNLLEGDNYY